MSGLDEVIPSDRKFFLLGEGEIIKTKLFLDIPNFGIEELIEYIKIENSVPSHLWYIEYRITTAEIRGCLYPIVEIIVPRWTWMKKKYRDTYVHQSHQVYMIFVKHILEYEAMKRRERRG